MTDAVEARRVDVAFSFYTGKAGMRVKDGVTEVAFVGRPPRDVGGTGTVDGAAVVIVSARVSDLTRGFAVLGVAPAAG